MDNVIPVFYAEYGRYISRFRMIPLDIDALLPVDRRLLLSGHEMAQKPTKSAKIVGYAMGTYHAHGSSSLEGALVGLVREGYFSSAYSTWGGPGLVDVSAPASRYTETCIEKWVDTFAFEYINNVPWDLLELSKEPLYLPCILPIGLIGDGIIAGIAYHKTVIPKYDKKDLAKRLLWLLENKKPELPANFEDQMSEKVYGPLIIPYKHDCDLDEEEPNAFYKLLLKGEGKLLYKPKIAIGTKDFTILGKVPNTTYQPFLNAFQKGKLPFSEKPIDQSKKNNVKIVCKIKRGINPTSIIPKIADDYLNKSISFKCYFCNLSGQVNQLGIDDILINCFNKWKEASLNKLISDIDKLNKKIIANTICSEIRKVLITYKSILSVDDLIKHFPKNLNITITVYNKSWKSVKYSVSEQEIRDTCKNNSIQRLIEYKSIDKELEKSFNITKNVIDHHDLYAIKRVQEIIND